MKATASRHLWCSLSLTGVLLLQHMPLPAQEPLTLKRAIEIAQRDSRSAKMATSTRDASQYRFNIASSRLKPQLTVGGTVPSYSRSINPVLQPDGTTLFKGLTSTNSSIFATMTQKLRFSGGEVSVTSSLNRLSYSGLQNKENWSSAPITIGLTQSLFQPNPLAWDEKERDINRDVTDRRFLEERENIAVTMTNLFFNAYSAELSLRNSLKRKSINDSLAVRNEDRYRLGRISENEKTQTDILVLRSSSEIEQARLDLDRASAALRLALNLPANAPLNLQMPFVVPTFDVDTARAVAEAVRNSVTPLQIELGRVQADRAVMNAHANTGFSANLTASVGFNGSAPKFNGVYTDPQHSERFTLGVSMPVYTGGARSNSIAAAEADRDYAAQNAARSMEQASQDAHFAALQLTLARKNLAIAARTDTAASLSFDQVYSLYNNGKATIDQLNNAQTSRNQAFDSLLNALRLYWQTYYQLRRVTLFDFENGAAIK